MESYFGFFSDPEDVLDEVLHVKPVQEGLEGVVETSVQDLALPGQLAQVPFKIGLINCR